jgi:Tol biopolymer transport system component
MSISKKWQQPRLLLIVFGLLLPFWLTIVSANTPPATTTRVSVASDGSQALAESNIYYGYDTAYSDPNPDYHPRFISDDGSSIVFATIAALDPQDTNGYVDIYLHDRTTTTTTRVSRAYDGGNPNGLSGVYGVTISNDGNVIAFASDASNLVPNDTNGLQDIFVYDKRTTITERVSLNANGTQFLYHAIEPVLDGDGSQVVFHGGGAYQHTLLDRTTGNQRSACPPPPQYNVSPCSSPTLSSDGRMVAYIYDLNGVGEVEGPIVVFEIATGITEIATEDMAGVPVMAKDPSFSADGRYLAFSSKSNHLVPDDIDDNGPDDLEGNEDIFRLDRENGTLLQLSLNREGVSPDGESRLSRLNADGTSVAFISSAWDLIPNDVNDLCKGFPLSTNGRPDEVRLGYTTSCADVFVADVDTGVIVRASVATDGTEANAGSRTVSISADGSAVAFVSAATNLVPNDTNTQCDYSATYIFYNCTDVFVHLTGDTRATHTKTSIPPRIPSIIPLPLTNLITHTPYGEMGDDDSYVAVHAISADGRYTVFTTRAGNLIPEDWNAHSDVYFYDRVTNTVTRISERIDAGQGNSDSFGAYISGNGEQVAFYSTAMLTPDLTKRGDVSLYLWERNTTTLTRLALIPALDRLSFSMNGTLLLFASPDATLVPDDTNGVSDLFIYNLTDATFQRVSVSETGAEANGLSRDGVLSADGRYLVYYSEASNLVPDDGNEQGDIFIYDRMLGDVERVALDRTRCTADVPCTGYRGGLSISADGRYIGFNTDIPLSSTDGNQCTIDPRDPKTVDLSDFYRYDRISQTFRLVSVNATGQQFANDSYGQMSADGQYAIYTNVDCLYGTYGNPSTFEINLLSNEVSVSPLVDSRTTTLSYDGTIKAYSEASQLYLTYPLPEGWHQRFLPLIQK